MTDAETLTAAAEKLRALAVNPDVTPGPWLCLDGGDRIIHDSTGMEFGPDDYVVDEPVSNSANAELIACMHPVVALALADLLQLHADVIAARAIADGHSEYAVDLGGEHALAVARAVLGKTA